MLIRDVLHEEKFHGVVYYFESNGFFSIAEIESFDFDLLYFVPGIADSIIVEAIELCKITIASTEHSEAEADVITNIPNHVDGISRESENSVEETETLPRLVESVIASLKKAEDLFANATEVKMRANEITASTGGKSKEVFTIICDELCKKVSSVGFTEEEIEAMKNIPIVDYFANAMMGNRRCGGALINYCLGVGKKTMWDMRDFVFDHSHIRGASETSVRVCKEMYEQFIVDVKAGKYHKEELTITDHARAFCHKWNSLNENMRVCAINGGRGKTLQHTAEEIGITRERVRQISLKVCRVLRTDAVPIVEALFKSNGRSFTDDDVFAIFNDENISTAFLFVIREGCGCKYVKFAKKFCSYDLPNNYEESLCNITSRYIGDGANFAECMEEIESALSKEGLPQFDFYDFLSYLLSCGYKLYGDFIVRNRNAYTLICYDVIKRHFKDGIKLESSNDCQDLAKLRSIVKDHYGNYELPDNNRAIVARIAPMLVLCDKSTYCIPERIQYSIELIDEIIAFVNESPDPYVFYDNLFRQFQGRLLMETTINTPHCLHGVIKLLYPHDFQYDRDGMAKVGSTRISLEQQITNVLLNTGRAMTRDEISKACPYAVGLRLANAVSRDPGIIQWAYNEYNHIGNIKISHRQKVILQGILRRITDSNLGYCNERHLLLAVEAELPEFIDENNISDNLNLFYILEYYFNTDFRFSRPHIVSELFPPEMPLTNMNVGKYFMGQQDGFSHKDFLAVAKKCNWSTSMISAILNELESEYIRINESDYIVREKFHLDASQILMIRNAIVENMNDEGYVALFAAFANGIYPNIGYEWNEFILDSIIRNFIPSFRIIEPIMKDRRYKRGIIIRENNPCATYEELVISVLIKDDFKSTPLDLFDDYLRSIGLLLNNVPQEILDSSKLSIKDDIVRLVL